jgi:hypothetical protein
MSDLPLMAKLAAALPEKAVDSSGDRTSLPQSSPAPCLGISAIQEKASLLPGFSKAERVTGCAAPASSGPKEPLSDTVVVLRSYRFVLKAV